MFQRLSSRSLLPLLFGAFLHACGGAPEGGEQTTDTDTLSTSQQQGEAGW